MVERILSSNLNLIQYGLANHASILNSTDKQPHAAINSTTPRDVQNDNKNGLTATKNTTLRDLQDDNKSKPLATQNSTTRDVQNGNKTELTRPGSSNLNHNLVYARRKSDAELINLRNSEKNQNPGHQQSQQLDVKRCSPHAEAKIKATDGTRPFARIPVNFTATPVRNDANEKPSAVDSQVRENWDSRFIRLQKYLKECDSSTQEDYVHKLRSVSRDELNRHAVELERRAIRLMLEEGREMERAKDLNILGK